MAGRSRSITLKYQATCRDCGAGLPEGTEARYYGRGRVYGLDCHDKRGGRSRPSEAGTWDDNRRYAEQRAEQAAEASMERAYAGGDEYDRAPDQEERSR